MLEPMEISSGAEILIGKEKRESNRESNRNSRVVSYFPKEAKLKQK